MHGETVKFDDFLFELCSSIVCWQFYDIWVSVTQVYVCNVYVA
jgi:hypothetical protein